ncbi:CRISPR-associated endoribonuclease Cas6 [Sulfoacidibacillus thermotolerans]|uniref:CRISPR-associated endoribonuclease n=1 Tax=Sulfoacidibacillus thermotolerans TaxID=1765684 RepID=A0A2U3D6U5_SULT2|nr:CRISPR-associated endoribonuclease Cas6 [Sulfoacidibacillus thermotolerans]PWI57009.1 CRISPR-associated endoribonuclease Cas6 [Sulfoacidibacillus thermotolerans]
MRCRIEMLPKSPLKLPLHYPEIVQGLIYRMLSDKASSTQLHDHGLRQVGGKPVKLFAYSKLLGKYRIDRNNKTISILGSVDLVVTSALDEMVYDLATSLLKADRISLHGTEMQVRQVQLQSYCGRNTHNQIRLLSPVVTYRTITQPNGKKFTQYYKPGTEEFDTLLRQNLALKANALGWQVTSKDVDLSLIPVNAGAIRERIILFHGSPIHAWDGDFRLQGSTKFIELAWNAGLGGKGSSGFGVFDVFSQGR